MAPHQGDDLDNALDARCRGAVSAYRLDAFDNVDVARLLGRKRLSREDARWIARHLMENGRALAAYSEGQAILAEAGRAG
ncbi:MAG: hypothetical protein ACRYGP_12290 [Janthinobacterium lividum]